MDITRISGELGWTPRENMASGLLKTVRWYLDNPQWIESVRSGSDINTWREKNYTNREAKRA